MEDFPSQPDPQAEAAAVGTGIHLRGWALASVLIGLLLTLLLSALDQTIVGTALPRIIGDLHGGDRYTWVVTGYLVASTTMIPVISKLSDQFGRKWFLMAGVVIFLIGSALSGASQTMNQLIAFRALQGIGGGMLMSLIFTLIGDIFPPAERARWQGLFTGVFALASVIGPAAGGWITDNTSWRWVFYVNLPVGIAAFLALLIWLPANISARSSRYRGRAALRRIDFPGALTAAGATVSLLLGLTWGGQIYDWNSPQVIGVLVAAGVLFIAFFIVERFAVEPLLPLDLFKNQVFAVGALLALGVGLALFAVAIYLPLFIQAVLGQTATNSGTVITPLTVTMAVGAAIVGLIIGRLGRYQFMSVLGAIVMTGGIYLLTLMNSSTSLLEVTRNMIIIGLGMGMLQPVMTLAVQNAIPRQRLGVGTGAVTYLRSMGATLGTAILGAVETNTFTSQFASRLPAQAHQLPSALLSQSVMEAALTNSATKHTLVTTVTDQATHQAVSQAVAQALPPAIAQATANVPAGPQHDQMVAAITQQVTTQVTAAVTQQVTAQVTSAVANLFNQVFDAARQAMNAGIHDSFVIGLGVSVAIIVLTLFLKDVPLTKREQLVPVTVEAGAADAAVAGRPGVNGNGHVNGQPPTSARGAGEHGEREAAPQGV